MTTIYERVQSALAGLAPVPVVPSRILIGTGSQLPDVFVVYSQVSAAGELHADDAETLRTRRVQVSVFSRAGLAGLPDVTGAMVAAGFTRGPERELAFDQVTQHYGLGLDFFYLEEQ